MAPGQASITGSEALQPHYDTARHYLGVNKVPFSSNADDILQHVAQQNQLSDKFYQTDVGIYFGGGDDDPYFEGKGPSRQACTRCGGCMVGCRHDGKNSLDKNYLYLAEKLGVTVIPETRVTDIRPIADGTQGYQLIAKSTTRLLSSNRKLCSSKAIVISAGALGTMKLLLTLKQNGSLPKLSDKLGHNILTNSESIIGIKKFDKNVDYSKGVAIGSGCYIDQDTHVEVVRYPKGSDSMGLLCTIMPQAKPGKSRVRQWLLAMLRHPIKTLRIANPLGFARSSIILLVMQTADNPLRIELNRPWWWPFGRLLQTRGDKIPAFIPQANDFAQKVAQYIGGEACATLPEILFDQPLTAHILGGCPMAENSQAGVIDKHNRVFNYPNMYVCDGSIISANLGVNPSLSITALTEHAMSHIPHKSNNPEFSGQII